MDRGWLAAAVISTAVTVSAQQAPPVFRSSVTLVPVEVTVLGADGRPVPGLTADDFEIKLNGKSRPVRTLAYVDTARPDAAAPATSVPTRLTARNTAPVDARVIVVGIDDLSVPPEGAKRTLEAARGFVAARPADEFIGLATTSGRVTVNPTRDHAAVVAALGRVVGEFADPRRAVAPGGPTVGLAEAAEIVDFNNQAVEDEVLSRECGEAGRTGGAGEALYAVAISAFNAKCAQDTLSAARLIAASLRSTMNQQVAALVDILHAMRGAPGVKQLVLVSGGVGVARTALTALQPVARAAVESGVRISVLMEQEPDLDMGGTVHGATEVGGQVRLDTGTSSRRRADNQSLRATLETLADMSGGTFETVITNGEAAFARAEASASAVYRLGVELPPDADPGKPLRVAASVRGRGMTVHANHEAVLPDAMTAAASGSGATDTPASAASEAVAPPASAERVRAAMQEGRAFYGVPVELDVVRRRAADGRIELGVGVRVPAQVDGPVTLTFGTVDAQGRLTQGTRTIAASTADYQIVAPMPVAPGPYRLRCAATDARGQIGSVDAGVDAALTPMGDWLASDVLTWRIDGGQAQLLPFEQLPHGLDELGAGLELYAGAVPLPADARVTLSLTADGADVPAVIRTVAPRTAATFLRAEAMLPVGTLPVGHYILRATLEVGARKVGEVLANITK
jgi:VWFA-related protein